jgi:hypothetical protein
MTIVKLLINIIFQFIFSFFYIILFLIWLDKSSLSIQLIESFVSILSKEIIPNISSSSTNEVTNQFIDIIFQVQPLAPLQEGIIFIYILKIFLFMFIYIYYFCTM